MATSVLQIVLHSHPSVRNDVINHATQYFPALGEQLQSNVHTVHGAGVALVIGLALTLWGAKGAADVLQYSLNHIWQVPRIRRPGFPNGPLKSLVVVVCGGIGFIAASVLSGLAASIGKDFIVRIIASLVSVVVLFAVFWFIFRVALAGWAKPSREAFLRSALTAAIGLQILQIAGNYLVSHQLGKLQHLYGTFAVTLGLLFWIYLQARVVMYAAEVGTVYDKRLWPRSLNDKDLTEADKRAYSDHAKRERYIMPEKIRVGFKNSGRGERT